MRTVLHKDMGRDPLPRRLQDMGRDPLPRRLQDMGKDLLTRLLQDMDRDPLPLQDVGRGPLNPRLEATVSIFSAFLTDLIILSLYANIRQYTAVISKLLSVCSY